jgi:hypothetical protein
VSDASFSENAEADGEARASSIVHGAGVGGVGGREDRIRLRRLPTSANSTSNGDDSVNITYGDGETIDIELPECYDAVLMTVSMDFDNPPGGTVNGGT